MANYEEYAWIVVIGALAAFFMAYGIGANDVANAFATSVGSKTLTLFQACILAGIFEFLGALLLGRGVTDTIKSSIVDRELFEDSPEILMYGMFCALIAAGTWLLVATYLEMPVSTTHSIIGGLVGMALVAYGVDAVNWYTYDADEVFPIKGITAVVLSWVFSPVASGIVAAFFFLVARTFILRADDSYKKAFFFLPVLVGIAFFINSFYVLDKGIVKQWGWLKESGTKASAWIAAIIAVVATLVGIGFSMWLKKKVDGQIKDGTVGVDLEAAAKGDDKPSAGFFGKLADAINSNDPHTVLEEDSATAEMHARAEVFKPETEEVFRYLQVLTSCADAFAHGANDVANSIGPFSAIWAVYRKQELAKKSDVPVWILVIGGTGIVIGLATYGYSIIRAIGVKLSKITPSRGFSIEMGSALIVVTGSYLGLPLSTTHCQVGATAFVGLLEGTGGVSYKVLGKTVFGWVFTIILVGFLSALMMVLGIRTPNVRNGKSINAAERSLAAGGATAASGLVDAGCPASPALEATGKYFRYFNNNFRFQDAVGDGISYMSGVQADAGSGTCPATFSGPNTPFNRAFRAYLPEDAADADKSVELANTVVSAQTALEVTAAAGVAENGADALEAYAELCTKEAAAVGDKWAAVFAAFADEDGNGVVVAEKGSPTNFIGEAEDLVGELEEAVEDGACAVSDINTTDVYKHLFPATVSP